MTTDLDLIVNLKINVTGHNREPSNWFAITFSDATSSYVTYVSESQALEIVAKLARAVEELKPLVESINVVQAWDVDEIDVAPQTTPEACSAEYHEGQFIKLRAGTYDFNAAPPMNGKCATCQMGLVNLIPLQRRGELRESAWKR